VDISTEKKTLSSPNFIENINQFYCSDGSLRVFFSQRRKAIIGNRVRLLFSGDSGKYGNRATFAHCRLDMFA
jgi:hypothetical protein